MRRKRFVLDFLSDVALVGASWEQFYGDEICFKNFSSQLGSCHSALNTRFVTDSATGLIKHRTLTTFSTSISMKVSDCDKRSKV